jgi:hypothetical protein
MINLIFNTCRYIVTPKPLNTALLLREKVPEGRMRGSGLSVALGQSVILMAIPAFEASPVPRPARGSPCVEDRTLIEGDPRARAGDRWGLGGLIQQFFIKTSTNVASKKQSIPVFAFALIFNPVTCGIHVPLVAFRSGRVPDHIEKEPHI